MKTLEIRTSSKVQEVFDNYPDFIRKQMLNLRQMVLETAKEMDEVEWIEETLKWGEPSYLTKHGSTLRMDWKAKKPDQYAMYFKCTSRLVETFKTVFDPSRFEYEGHRAIIFKPKQRIPKRDLKKCIMATLNYHKVKNLETLGI